VCCGFLSPFKKSIALAGFEPATFGSSGKHTNHYTTKATTCKEMLDTMAYRVQGLRMEHSCVYYVQRRFMNSQQGLVPQLEETVNITPS
jgi:hypothetical protein